MTKAMVPWFDGTRLPVHCFHFCWQSELKSRSSRVVLIDVFFFLVSCHVMRQASVRTRGFQNKASCLILRQARHSTTDSLLVPTKIWTAFSSSHLTLRRRSSHHRRRRHVSSWSICRRGSRTPTCLLSFLPLLPSAAARGVTM